MTNSAIINSLFPSTGTMARTKSEDSVQLLYAEQCTKDRRLAGNDGLLYRWQHDHWEALSDLKAQGTAFSWLSQFDRNRATAAIAQSCVEAAKLLVRQLPASPKHKVTIIPLPGCWLFVDPTGAITAIEPDIGVGICHRISCEKIIPPGSYTPGPLKPDSLFAQFLASSLPNQEVQDFVQEYIGYTLTGTTKLQVGTLWVGAGSNGKSLLLNVVRALHEKSVAVRLDKLAGFDLAGLVGASLAFCDETPKSKINQQALKSLISGGAVQVEPKYGKPFNYRSTAKFIICSNHLPSATDHSDGWWRRLHIVEWNEQIKGSKVIYDLDQKIIETELDTVLDWALLGLQRLLARGTFAVPQVMEQAKQDAIQTSNTVSSWAQDAGVALSTIPSQMVTKADLYDRYRSHCQQHSLMPVGNAEFFKRIKAIFPTAMEDRVVLTVNGKKERVRRLGLMLGQFDVSSTTTVDPQADINAILMANIPMPD